MAIALNPLNDSEKGRIQHFLGYPDWRQLAPIIALGLPSGTHFYFLLNATYDKLGDAGLDSIRRDLAECECIERQLSDARSRFKAESIGNMKLQAKERVFLRQELAEWTARLASDLGILPNPYQTTAGSEINGTIS